MDERDFLEGEWDRIQERIEILDKIEQKLIQMKNIASMAEVPTLPRKERMDLNEKFQVLQQDLNQLSELLQIRIH